MTIHRDDLSVWLHVLPPTAIRIAKCIGIGGLLKIVGRFGGTTIRVSENNDLDKILNKHEYDKFIHFFKNKNLYIATLKMRNAEIQRQLISELYADGYSINEIARELKLSNRTVYYKLSRTKK